MTDVGASNATNTSEVDITTATTFTVSVSATITSTFSSTPTSSPSSASQHDINLLHDSIIVASVLGGFIIFLISTLALIYCFYKRRKRLRELHYSPPFASLAPPRRSGLTPLSIHSSPIQPEQPQETSLSMGPGMQNAPSMQTAEPAQRHSRSIVSQQPSLDTELTSPDQNLPAILLQSTPPSPIDTPTGRPRAKSRLYHDVLREETESDKARRRGRLDAPSVATLRPLSSLSDISDMDPGPLRPSAEHDRAARRVTLTRASSGVFPHD